MKRALFIAASLFCVLLLFATQSTGQCRWFWQNPRPVGDPLGKIQFVSPSEGWITVGSGILLHTTDGGDSFETVCPDPNTIFEIMSSPGFSLSFVDAATGWVIGTFVSIDEPSGTALYKTTDGGQTWVQQNIGADLYGLGVQFTDASTGWAVTADGAGLPDLWGSIYRTTNGGNTWIQQYTTNTGNIIMGISFVDATRGWAIVDSMVLEGDYILLAPPMKVIRTVDGGTSWDTVLVDTSYGSFNAVQFVDAMNGWVVGDSGKVLVTSDGGTNWTPKMIDPSLDFYSLFFLDPNTGWISGGSEGGRFIFHTTDGGMNWAQQNPGTETNIFSLYFTDTNSGWASADYGGITRTIDGGSSWEPLSSSVTWNSLKGVHFVDSYNGWAVGSWGTILRTADGGCIWSVQSPPWGSQFNDVFFTDALTGWAVGGVGGGPSGGAILKTIDGGSNWVIKLSSIDDLYSVHFVNSTTGWAVGHNGIILKTTDGGENWTVQPVATFNQLKSVWFINANVGWVVGGGGIILHTIDGGTNWIFQTSYTYNTLNDATFIDANTGWVVGDNGVILRTTDSGFNWSQQSSGTEQDLKAVSFLECPAPPLCTGVAAGDGGTILRTTDGGGTWSFEAGGTTIDIFDAIYIDEIAGIVAVGEAGAIIGSKELDCVINEVTITHFGAEYDGEGVWLSWTIGRADVLKGFNIYRSSGQNGTFRRINRQLIPASEGERYHDANVQGGRSYKYRLGAVDSEGEWFSRTIEVTIPSASVALYQNHPNPFNPFTVISFYLPVEQDVVLSVYDTQGRRVRTLIDGFTMSGKQEISWNGRNDQGKPVSSGVYYYRLKAGKIVLTRKLIVLR